MSSDKKRVLPGLKPVFELLRQEPERIVKIIARRDGRHNRELQTLCHKNGVPLELAHPEELDDLCADLDDRHVSHQGVAAILSEARFLDLDTLLASVSSAPLPLVIGLDQIRDPGNLGTICRTAWALGCAGLILPKHNSASLGPAALRASAGALEKIPCCVVANLARALDEARERDFTIYGTSGNPPCESGKTAPQPMNAFSHEWRFPLILVLGSEERGIRPGILKRCDYIASIPLRRKFDSLNVAQAGAIILGLCSAFHNPG